MRGLKSKFLPFVLLFASGIAIGHVGTRFLFNASTPIEAAAKHPFYQPKLLQLAKTDQRVAQLSRMLESRLRQVDTETLAQLNQNLCNDFTPTAGRKNIERSCVTDGRHGSELVQLAALALYDHYREADFVLQNAGIGQSILVAGPLTSQTMAKALPFHDRLVWISMKGQALKDGLEGVLGRLKGSSGASSYPYAAGFRFHVDMNQPEGSRLTQLEVKDRSQNRWVPLDPNQTYKILTSAYLAEGRDGYTMLVGQTTQTLPEEDSVYEILARFLRTKVPADVLSDDEYSTQAFIQRS